MAKLSTARKAFAMALAGVLVAGVFALAGCASSSSSSSASASASSSSSSADVMYTVPNVISLTQADAEKAIYASGLQVGTVTQQASDSVAKGAIISQDPQALTSAKANSKINLVVSTGKAEAKDVNVPDLKGKTQAEAEKALSDVGLVGMPSNPEESTEVSPGQVFKQSVAAGTTVKEGTKIAFTVATAPQQVTVPDLTGKTRDDAKATLANAKLGFDNTTSYSDTVEEGKVISQSVAAGTKVNAGTTVSVVVSLGAKPASDVKVPDVITYSWNDAEVALRSAGLAARYTGDPAGTVVAQDVAAGTMVAPNTLVTVTLASPVVYVTVPDLVGLSVTSAEQVTDSLNLVLATGGVFAGTIVDQYPAAGTQVEERSDVFVTVEEPVQTWTPASSAADAAKKAGLDGFDVMKDIVLGGRTLSNPSFFYNASGAVKALYDAPAMGVSVCKSAVATVPLSDYDASQFPQKWTQNHKGLEITCYGNQADAATIIEWKIGSDIYVATFMGYGGETMTMDPSDVTSLVSGIQ